MSGQGYGEKEVDQESARGSGSRILHGSAELLPITKIPPRTNITRRLATFLRPSLFSRHKTVKLRSTACLDGLRGLAAFIVYIAHSEAWKHDNDVIQLGFGYVAADSMPNYALITLPFFRIFFTGGAAAVAVFFVISGFVLSRHPLVLIHKKSEEIYPVLSSAVFRRAIRLYFPFIGVTFTWFTMWHLFGLQLEWPKAQATYLGEIQTWWAEFVVYVNPFQKPGFKWFTYDFPLWTIPVEYQGSILVFTTLLSFARLSIKARLSLTSVMAVYFLYIGIWQSFCFLSGLIIAEADLILSQRIYQLPTAIARNQQKVLWLVFIVATYLASQPSLGDQGVPASTPGWRTLTSLIPKTYVDEQWWRFWHAIAAPLIILSTTQTPLLRRLLELRFLQYLGRISFALYLIHIPVQVSFGDVIFRMTGFSRASTQPSGFDNWFPLPDVGPLGFEVNFLLPQMIILPVTLYISELVTKIFDEPSVWIGRLAYDSVVEW